MVGVILVATGAGLLARRFLPFGWEQALLLALGLAFGILGIVRRGYGSLVVGMVLLSIGAGLILGDRHALGVARVHWMMLCLGLAFVAVYLIALMLQMKKHWWPLVPAAVLLLLGGNDTLWRMHYLPESLVHVIQAWWPVVLVVFGVALLVRAYRK